MVRIVIGQCLFLSVITLILVNKMQDRLRKCRVIDLLIKDVIFVKIRICNILLLFYVS